METNLFGPLNVTRAVLPRMRAQRSGLVVTTSSTAGIAGLEFSSAYAASKFAIEGWMESITPELAPYRIRTMLVEPGFFRTDLLENNSTVWPEPTIADYAERTRQTVLGWQGMNGKQGGDPAKLADALVHLAGQDVPPCVGPPARMRSRPSRRRPKRCSIRSGPTGSFPPRSPSRTPPSIPDAVTDVQAVMVDDMVATGFTGVEDMTIPLGVWNWGISDKWFTGALAGAGRDYYERLLTLIEYGKLDPSPLVTHVLHGWDKIDEGLDLMRSHDASVIKPVIVVS